MSLTDEKITVTQLAKKLKAPTSSIRLAARKLRLPVVYNESGTRVFDKKQEKMITISINENVLTEELKKKIKNLICELLENTPAGYAVKFSDLRNFLISQHIKRDFCQYGCISLIAGNDFVIYDTGTYGAKTVIALSPKHEFITEEASEQRMNELLPYYHKPKTLLKVV